MTMMMRRRCSSRALVVAAAAVALLSNLPNLLLRPPILPSALDVLQRSQIMELTGAFGPESLAFDPHGGGPYTGVSDGRILKWDPRSRSWLSFAFTSPNRSDGCVHPIKPEQEHQCGRPLGLRFHSRTGDLYIADAYLGLLVVGPSGGLATQLASQVEQGQPFRFTNDLDIDEQQHVIYFTETSTRFYRREFILSPYSGDKTGRLMKYMSSGEVNVLAQGLANANGLVLSKDRSSLLVAETTASRISRYWLRGPNAGRLDTFVELPGLPDNTRRNAKGEFWVALAAKGTRFASWVLSSQWFRQLMLKLPLDTKQLVGLLLGNRPHATAVRLSEEGQVLEILEDSKGRKWQVLVRWKKGKGGVVWICYDAIYRHLQLASIRICFLFTGNCNK